VRFVVLDKLTVKLTNEQNKAISVFFYIIAFTVIGCSVYIGPNVDVKLPIAYRPRLSDVHADISQTLATSVIKVNFEIYIADRKAITCI